MKPFHIPVVAIGPGSQPDSEPVSYFEMPHDMATYRPPVLPEPEDMPGRTEVKGVLGNLLAALARGSGGADLAGLAPEAVTLLGQVLGEGEVSARVETGDSLVLAQESVFAGVWRLRVLANGALVSDTVEVADVPSLLRAGPAGAVALRRPDGIEGVANAPALLAEIEDRLARGGAPHVINLTLLPFTPGDGEYLDQALGRGGVSILSRGYGNCRITATALPGVWWVQYFNAADALILNTIEVVDVPDAARAAPEDLADSRERLAEVVAWLG